MSDPGNISSSSPAPIPEDSSASGNTGETFGERLRRRRRELESEEPPAATPSNWQSRARNFVALVVESPHAAAAIARKNAENAKSMEGVEAVLFAEDLPLFHNTLGHEYSGEPLLAEDEVHYRGQPIALIIAADERTCREAAKLIEIEYHTSPGILTLDHAIAMESFHPGRRSCQRGVAIAEVNRSKRRLSGSLHIAPQQAGMINSTEITVRPINGGEGVKVHSRSLLPTAVKTAVARAYDLPESRIELEPVDLPGPIGALEIEPVRLTSLAAHASRRCCSAVTLKLESSDSPLASGARHETRANFEVGYHEDGTIQAATIDLQLDGGWYAADSETTMDRALLHADAVYGIPNFQITARLCRTNRIASSSLPAEGSAQGCWAMEEILRRVAAATGRPPHEVRQRNFYREDRDPKTTPYGQPINSIAIQRVWQQALGRSRFESRLKEVEQWNRKHSSCKRGIGVIPIKFGIGDPRSDRNAASVVVQILADGSVVVRVGIVDTNERLDAQIREEVASLLGIEPSTIHVVPNDFGSLPRATPVLGTDAAGLILRAIDQACQALRNRLQEVALQMLAAKGQTEVEMESIRFEGDLVGVDPDPDKSIYFKDLVEGAWRKRINLVETGYHRTPNLWWDPDLGAGWPFSSFTHAAGVCEIQIDAFTGEVQLLQLDIAHEGSPSSDQGDRDFAQLMRSFTLGAGWLLSETSPDPENRAVDPHRAEESIPGFGDAPLVVNTDRMRPLGDNLSVAGDPCGEAPVLLAGAIQEALHHALTAFGLNPDLEVELPLPATPPRVLETLKDISQQMHAKKSRKSSPKGN
ncbi:MAG: molybdopterin cofactor-binding domain-containing protein [Verrucomicrobiota bacterium]